MTKRDDGNTYFFDMAEEGGTNMRETITITRHQPIAGSKVMLLGYDKPLSWSATSNGFTVQIPAKARREPPCDYVWTIKVDKVK